MRRSRFFAGMLAALFTFAAVSCANNVGGDPSGSQGNSANPSGSQDASSSSEPSGPQNSPSGTGSSGSQDLPGSTDKESEDLLGPDSKGGHLSLEAVEGGIKVTVRVLDSDIPEGKKLTSMNFFYIEETSTRIRLDLNKNLLLESAGDDRVNELSGIFPFTKADTDYKFEYAFDMQDNGNKFYPSTKESAACKATSTGLSLDEYFDYEYAPYKAKVMVNDKGIMSIDKDVSQFIKKDDAEIFISGDVVSGVYYWSDAEWCAGWESIISNYEPGWRCRIDYKELFEGNADLGSIVLQDSYTARKLCKRDTWSVTGAYNFSFPGIETGFLMAINSASKGEGASSEMFRAPLLDNPFKGKTFIVNNHDGYVINFIDDTIARFSKISDESEPEVVAEYAYRASRVKMYLETQKVNIGGTLCNREECMEMWRTGYPEKTDEQLNIMLSQLFARKEIGYDINPQTGGVSFYGIQYDNPEDYLVNDVSMIPINEYYSYNSDDLGLFLRGSSFSIYRSAQDDKRWRAISVNDGIITYTDENFTETFTIPYRFRTFNYENVLTITYEGQSYDLRYTALVDTGTTEKPDEPTTPDVGTTDTTDVSQPPAPGNDGNGGNDTDIISSLDLTNLDSGWYSSYDAATKTITFDGLWKGRGWWEPTVPEGAKKIKFTFNETTGSEIKVLIVGEYNDESLNDTLVVEAGSKTAVYELKDSSLKQIFIQNAEEGSLSLVACDWTK